MKTATVTVALSRLRERYQELLRAEIADTVATREEIDDELRHLAAAISE
jgi:RNA polymerase sigma-70 factor (ECF subfamily)